MTHRPAHERYSRALNEQEQRAFALRRYVDTIWRRRRLVVGVFAVFVGVSMIVSFSIVPKYVSSVQLRYQRQPDINSALSGTTPYQSPVDTQQQLDTTATLMKTSEIAQAAKAFMHATAGRAPVTITATPVTNTSLLTVTAASTSATRAADVANAYGNALVSLRKAAMLKQYGTVEQILTNKIATYRTPEERAQPAYNSLVYNLQSLLTLKGLAQGDFQVAAVAQVPSSPSTPQHGRDLMLAIILGTVVAIAAAFVAEQLDVHVHDADDLSTALRLPIIGRVPAVSRETVKACTLAVTDDPHGISAEAFRMLRGNLDFVDIDHKVSTMLVTSPTQGEGKTPTACSLAVTMARMGQQVMLVDADLRRPRAHAFFGLGNSSGLSTVVAGRTDLSETVSDVDVDVRSGGASAIEGETGGRLRVLTAGPIPPNPGEIVTSRRFAALVQELKEEGGVVIIDAPPFLAVGDAAALAQRVDGVLVVMRMGTETRSSVKETASFLAKLSVHKLGIVVTNTGGEARYRYVSHYIRRGAPQATPAAPDDSASPAES